MLRLASSSMYEFSFLSYIIIAFPKLRRCKGTLLKMTKDLVADIVIDFILTWLPKYSNSSIGVSTGQLISSWPNYGSVSKRVHVRRFSIEYLSKNI
jgi:hypothetical protein